MNNQKCLDTNNAIKLPLLQIGSTTILIGPPSPATLLFNRQIRDILPQINRELFNINNDDA